MYVSPDPAARRRRTALAAAAGAALLIGLVVGAGAGNGNGTGGEAAEVATTPSAERREQALRAVDRLSLRQQVGQLTISSFDGTSRPDYIRRRLRARETAG